ncbi:2244_t:CDS:2 [Scutellospora calospora]|uniref:2244_t:CDS:1 n=1 Tax=Scutellospora calospora TaxID=85575 RepID=A0ACA9L293_9GLOM|nr:2244_t:CDS:2 [Scutellospora calospora]
MAPDVFISSNILPARKKIHAQLHVRKNNNNQLLVHNINNPSSIINNLSIINNPSTIINNPSSIINIEHFEEISTWINLQPGLIEIIIHKSQVIGCSYIHGYYSHNSHYYEKQLSVANNSILIDEFEVFQVIRN